MTQWVWEEKQRQADTLAFPYGTSCKAIGVCLHEPDCHWLVMISLTGWGWSITFGEEGKGVGVSWWPRGLDGRGSPVACHSPCTTAWPPTLSGLHNGRSRTQLYEQSSPHSSSQQPTEEGQKESKYSGQALVLYRPWKTSLLEAAEQWISALFPTESLILAVSVGLNSRAQALTETPRDNLLQQTCIAIIQSH